MAKPTPDNSPDDSPGTTPDTTPGSSAEPTSSDTRPLSVFERDLAQLRRRIMREATTTIDMLEVAVRGLWTLDTDLAREVRRLELRVDAEEVAIEAECLRLMTLRQPFGTDFRTIAFCLKANGDLERVGDHASSIAKITLRLVKDGVSPQWPEALVELGERVPVFCHRLLRAVLDVDEEAARELVTSDQVIDSLDKQLFEELTTGMDAGTWNAEAGLLCYRLGRELERVGDLMTNIAEDVVYLTTGEIIRHTKVKDPDAD
ncbi:MAG: phosphate transport system protein [Phycisphaerales bacterium]|jgi:phosphate transport system protein